MSTPDAIDWTCPARAFAAVSGAFTGLVFYEATFAINTLSSFAARIWRVDARHKAPRAQTAAKLTVLAAECGRFLGIVFGIVLHLHHRICVRDGNQDEESQNNRFDNNVLEQTWGMWRE